MLGKNRVQLQILTVLTLVSNQVKLTEKFSSTSTEGFCMLVNSIEM